MVEIKTKTVAAGAKKCHEYLLKIAKVIGCGELDLPKLWTPQKTAEMGYGKAWAIVWEGGPYEWAINFGMAPIWAGETGNYSGDRDISCDDNDWHAEAYNGCLLKFYKD